MSLSQSRILCLTVSALALAAVASQANASSPTGYLTWQGKSNAPQQPASQPYPSNPVPPSPYGQVGNPFAQTLNWPTKSQPNAPAPRAPEQAQDAQPHQTLASVSVPVPLSQPAPVAVMQLPPPPPRVTVPTPQPTEQHQIAPQPAAPQPVAPVQQPRPVAVAPAPKPAPAAPVVAAAPAPQPASADAGYQVPATSKYAARIASARAAVQPTPQAPVSAPAAPPPAKPAAVATAPEPGASMASEETDHVFIPGEHYTDASDEPRYYSLHRQYGIKPDPITVDHNATGALLDTTHLDAQESKDDDASSDDPDTSDSSDSSSSSDAPSSSDDSQPAN